MKFRVIQILSVFAIMILMVSCQANSTKPYDEEKGEIISYDKTNQLNQPPELYIIHNDIIYQGVKGTCTWGYISTDGKHVVPSFEADAGPPNELVEYQEEQIIISGDDTFEIYFENMPERYVIAVWNNNNTKPVKYADGSKTHIIVPNDRDKVIYSARAFWEQGNAYYAFEITIDD